MESYTPIDEGNWTPIHNDFYSDRNLDPYEKTVLSYLIRYYNFNFGYSFPTREQIQHDNNISPSKLTKTLKSLQEKGYITIKNNHKKAGRNNIYYINKYLVGQETSSQASKTSNTDNKSSNEVKQVTGANKKPKKTAWNDHYQEQHWQRYSEDELEAKLIRAQNEKKRKELLKDEGLSEKLGYIDAYFSLSRCELTRDFTSRELEYLANYTIYQVDEVLNSLEAEKIEPKEFLEKLDKVRGGNNGNQKNFRIV
nr:MAG: replication initiator protein A [Bacteriophage sp.]